MTFETEQFGRYEIKSGPLQGNWAANAFRHKTRVAQSTGSSREEAVALVKTELSKLDIAELAERDDEGSPPAHIYESAFSILLPAFPPSYVVMLRAYLAAPDYSISATKLAQAAGYANYGGANLHYGMLGQRVAQEIGFDPPKREDGTPIWTCAIARDRAADAEFPHTSMLDALIRNVDAAHFEWQMRPQVVTALKALGF